MQKDEVKREALTIVNDEMSRWEDALCDVTDNIRMKMRDTIKQCRKNYYGIFDTYDEDMVWIPVTEQSVEDTIKQFDLDQKDLRVRARNGKATADVDAIRAITKDRLDKIFFGMTIDDMERSLAIDGTAVWKTWKGVNKEGKPDLMVKKVDLLNFYIDPTASSIYDTEAVIERIVMPINEFRRVARTQNFADWEDISGDENVPVFERNGVTQKTGRTKNVELYERWGLVPEYLITGDKKDIELVEARIVTSGKDKGARVHLIARNTKKLKPYEEAWYVRVPGRWYGRGVAEKLLMLQMWANMVKNIHIVRQKVSQLGLWKVRQNSGITPQMLKKLPVNGAITVKRMDDIEQLVMQEASPASYRDMDDIQRWSQKITAAVETISPESLSASTATTSVINDRNNKSTFTLVREGIGLFFQRWLNRHALPAILSLYKTSDVVRILGDDEAARPFIRRQVAKRALQSLKDTYDNKRRIPTQEEFERAFAKAEEKMVSAGDIMVNLKKQYEAGDVEMITYITNEEMDVSVVVQNLLALLPLAPEFKPSMVKNIYNLMGLPQPVMSDMPNMRLPQQAEPPKAGAVQQTIKALAGSRKGESLAGQAV